LRRPSAIVVAIAAGAVVRGALLLTTQVVAIDGITYIDQARMMVAGRLADALAMPFPPGYPAAIAALHTLLGMPATAAGWELSG